LHHNDASSAVVKTLRIKLVAWHYAQRLLPRWSVRLVGLSGATRLLRLGTPCHTCPGPRSVAGTASGPAPLPPSAIDPGPRSHRPIPTCARDPPTEIATPDGAPTPGTNRTHGLESSRHTCGKSAGSATGTCTTGTSAPPSRVACTATPPRPSPDRGWCGA